jgi:tellurite resistance protein
MGQDLAAVELIFQAVVLASFADGEPSPVELKTLQALMAQYPQFAAQHDLRQLLLHTHRLIRQIGANALLDRIASGLVDRGDQELAFSLAGRMVAADGKTAPGEATMLRRLSARFGFTAEDVLRLLA